MAEIKEIENRKMIEKINETKSWFFGKINKIDKILAKLAEGERETERERERERKEETQMINIRNETGGNITDLVNNQ